ncbi:embigin isoform X1 [Oryzias melastigma]|uniref:Embigin n=2 Tax=Oryzias melastigma TaxID=30732 RepID=A0A3B3BPW0_ORYME|nr:embigin isoform X1 [Oryzias melastigma]
MENMPASWKLLLMLLLVLTASCGRVHAETLAPSPKPLASVPALSADMRKVAVLKSQNSTQNVQLLNPVNLSLECSLTADHNNLPNISAFWSQDGREIPDSRLTVALENQQYHLQRLFYISGEEMLGSYSCVFENGVRADFILATPPFGEVRDKPVVSYVRDFVVLPCKMEEAKPKPLSWRWFRGNKTHKEQISEQPERFQIHSEERKSKLKVINLTHEDAGVYYCGAVYAIGTTMNPIELKVITYQEPLKPFIGILIEVVLLVAVIFLCEKRRSKKNTSKGNEENVDQNNIKLQEEEKGAEEGSSMRQRKV